VSIQSAKTKASTWRRYVYDRLSGVVALEDNLVFADSRGLDFSARDYSITGTLTSALYDGYSEGTWTPSFTGLTVVGTPTYTGHFTITGRVVVLNLQILSTTTTASAGPGTTSFAGLPVTPGTAGGAVGFVDVNGLSLGMGLNPASSGTIFCPSWSAVSTVYMSYTYQI